MALCLLAGCITIIPQPAFTTEEPDPEPLLLLKIPGIDKLLSDVQTVMPQNPQSKAPQPLTMVRTMLFGIDWIDPGRSIVAAMVPSGSQPEFILLVPFRTANDNFQKNLNAVMGADLGSMSLLFGLRNGKLMIQNSFNIKEIDRLMSAIAANASKQEPVPPGRKDAATPETQ